MPFKVRCRCGQEVVVRPSEWVYFLAGLLLVSLVVNAGALVLLFFELSNDASNDSSSGGRVVDESGPVVTIHPDVAETIVPETASGAPVELVGSDPSSDDSEPVDTVAVDTVAVDTVAVEPLLPLSPVEAGSELSPEALLRDLVAELEQENESATGSRAGVERVEPVPKLPRHAAAPEHSFRVLLEDLPPFARLVAASELGSQGDSPGDQFVVAALLHDPDPRVRRQAVARLWRRVDQSGRSADERLERWVSAASPWLRGDSVGQQLLERLVSKGASQLTRFAAADLPWEATRRRATVRLAAVPGFGALRDALEQDSRHGVDIVLAVDVSVSMEVPFKTLETAAPRWIPSVLWALPNSRCGLLFYRDDVVAVRGLDAPVDGLLESFRRFDAEGGGDVPEGVFTALQAALQLGRFSWRADARKVIAFVGDAPPPYAEVRAMLSLARRASQEGGYRIHTVGVQPEKGRDAVPYFTELADAGGGEGATADSADLPATLFRLLFPAASHALVERSFASLENVERPTD